MNSDEPSATVRREPVRLPSDGFHTSWEAITRDEWLRRHDRTYTTEDAA